MVIVNRAMLAAAISVAILATAAHAQWTVTRLNPNGYTFSVAYGVPSGTQQAGVVATNTVGRASLWSGTAASWINLNPAGATESTAFGASLTQQVGLATVGGVYGAGLWSGTAGSWVSLHPVGAGESTAYCTTGTQQAVLAVVGGRLVASLWSGTAASWINLSPAGSTDCYVNGMFGTQQVGSANVGGIGRASLWSGTAASWEDLSLVLTGSWSDTNAKGIWSDGSFTYVIGQGINNATGNLEALLWKRPNTTVCLADVVRDNVVDGTDFVACINSFEVGNVAVDAAANVAGGGANGLAPDGIIDGSDFVAFINAFSAGC